MSSVRTIAVSISGNTGAGKTVLAQEIANHLQSIGYAVCLHDGCLTSGPIASPFAGQSMTPNRAVAIGVSIDSTLMPSVPVKADETSFVVCGDKVEIYHPSQPLCEIPLGDLLAFAAEHKVAA
jgi:Mrp family chromosome partitioning ATPase